MENKSGRNYIGVFTDWRAVRMRSGFASLGEGVC